MSTAQLDWNSVLSEAQKRVRKQQFDTWFSNISLVDLKDDKLLLGVPNAFFRDWLKTNYIDVIKESVKVVTGNNVEIAFRLSPNDPEEDPTVGEAARVQVGQPAYAPESPRPFSRDLASLAREVGLHSQYIFNNFVVGPCNNLAHAAALAVAETPSQAYNPLFMHGSVGLGKTHLVQAIAHALLNRRPRPKILYMSCENFMNQFISAVRHGDIENFRYRYRQVDALLIDDIHFLGKGDRTQEEFFHTFNALYNAQKQIVITSDSPPKEIPTIEERLVSRFKWGMVAKLSQPTYETRVAIIQKKAQLKGRSFPEEVVNYIAEHIASNIREIEGAIIKIIGYASLMNKQIDIILAKDALLDTIDRERTTISIEDTQNAVVGHFKIKLSDLQSKKRSKAISHPRQVCMYLARKLTDYSLKEIGGYFGGRDHSTVMHACDKITNMLETDTFLAATIERLTEDMRKNVSKKR
ncbi:MAG: chromosomal replication initiator protein DnaA [Planctomycetes bacterium]|nr:chromosomal replication initiator protein DnaA [Planctomycetota bacterium]